MRSLLISDEAAMIRLGAHIGPRIAVGSASGVVVYLVGDLGAGKTTLVKGILAGLGYEGAVTSPTFTLVEPYDFGETQFYHFDLYRLESAEELEQIGIRDMLSAQSVGLFEWPDKGAGVLPEADHLIEIAYDSESEPEGQGRVVQLPEVLAEGWH